MNKITTAEAITRTLISHGVDTIFGLPGIQNDTLHCTTIGMLSKLFIPDMNKVPHTWPLDTPCLQTSQEFLM